MVTHKSLKKGIEINNIKMSQDLLVFASKKRRTNDEPPIILSFHLT